MKSLIKYATVLTFVSVVSSMLIEDVRTYWVISYFTLLGLLAFDTWKGNGGSHVESN